MGKKKIQGPPAPRTVIYQRPRWKHWSRYFGVAVILMLNYSLVMSTIQLHQSHHALSFVQEAASFAVVLLFDVAILLPNILEVDGVAIAPDYLILNLLFGKVKLSWADIVYFEKPLYLNYAVLRSARWIYLLNKRDLERFEELVEIIQRQRAKVAK